MLSFHFANPDWSPILQSGFVLTDIYQDTNGTGRLHEFNVPYYYATRAIKK